MLPRRRGGGKRSAAAMALLPVMHGGRAASALRHRRRGRRKTTGRDICRDSGQCRSGPERGSHRPSPDGVRDAAWRHTDGMVAIYGLGCKMPAGQNVNGQSGGHAAPFVPPAGLPAALAHHARCQIQPQAADMRNRLFPGAGRTGAWQQSGVCPASGMLRLAGHGT